MTEPEPPGGTPPITILIVDDVPDMRFLARHYLESAGFQVADEAIDGHDAVAKFLALGAPPIPTVVLIDNMMPKLTGLEAAAQMLAQSPDQLIVLYSAYLDDSVHEAAKRLGVTACVSKSELENLPTIIGDLITARG
ncbi:MAG: response regulator [Frankiaceae bacterium]|nr:response regulator [Frankiaceae bacterium]